MEPFYRFLLLRKIKKHASGQLLIGLWQLQGLWRMPLTVARSPFRNSHKLGVLFTISTNNKRFSKSASTHFTQRYKLEALQSFSLQGLLELKIRGEFCCAQF